MTKTEAKNDYLKASGNRPLFTDESPEETSPPNCLVVTIIILAILTLSAGIVLLIVS